MLSNETADGIRAGTFIRGPRWLGSAISGLWRVMRVLLSTYSCGPDLGSEPGIGWNWALRSARLGHEVLLLMRAVDVGPVEAALTRYREASRIRIIPYDPPWLPNRAKTGHRLIRFHNLLWQIGAFFFLRRRIKELEPDLVHHLTWGVFRQPSLLGLLGRPFVFGPVGGGETAPTRLRYHFSALAHLFEALRDALNWLALIDPLMTATFSRAGVIAVKTDETKLRIPQRFHHKVVRYLELGIDASVLAEPAPREVTATSHPLRILFVGRLIHWKGIYYVAAAYRRLMEELPEAELTIVGQGIDAARLKRFAGRLGIAHRIRWIARVEHTEMGKLYRGHDLCLFPSLHDSSGNVALEALSHGLPVVTLDLGGPKEIVDESCGRVIGTKGLMPDEVITALARALYELNDGAVRETLVEGARARARDFIWEHRIQKFYGMVGEALGLYTAKRRAVATARSFGHAE
ncbi:MAG TPA: glycosyltransferase family 4 protein [Stellaceae bacterium]|nr:glycosyltransferase family 4 protein [Stellaceae bacterium]